MGCVILSLAAGAVDGIQTVRGLVRLHLLRNKSRVTSGDNWNVMPMAAAASFA